MNAWLEMEAGLLAEIEALGESAYPNEGAGLLLGKPLEADMGRQVQAIYSIANARSGEARQRRYLLTPQDYLCGEQEAERLGLQVIGVFHSHPDHPDQPSSYDRDWALPWFSYLITSVQYGRAVGSRSWRLAEDRSQFVEEDLWIHSLPDTSGKIVTGEKEHVCH